MTVFEAPEFAEHDEVVFCRDSRSGLRAIIAIHDTAFGPAVGGCRMWPYETETEAIRDALRLSRGMSYKSAMAGLPLGGGKSVIIGDPRRDKTEALLRAFGRCIDRLGGRYVAAEDVGLSVEDIETIGLETRHVAGLSMSRGASGDPSPLTACGVYEGMRAAVRHRLGREGLGGLRIAVQGLGHVGMRLCEHLHQEGAELLVADLDAGAVEAAVRAFGAKAVPADLILAQEVDVVAPCALGAVLDDESIPRLRARVIAGAANNQLAEERHGVELAERGILYAPDYVINAGGIINVAGEVCGDYDLARSMERVAAIADTLHAIFDEARRRGEATSRVADRIARARLEAARAVG